jgi:hypothetical protein
MSLAMEEKILNIENNVMDIKEVQQVPSIKTAKPPCSLTLVCMPL